MLFFLSRVGDKMRSLFFFIFSKITRVSIYTRVKKVIFVINQDNIGDHINEQVSLISDH